MKKDKSRDRKKAGFERDIKIKKVKGEKLGGKQQWKRFVDDSDD